jgi:hypothetical protein
VWDVDHTYVCADMTICVVALVEVEVVLVVVVFARMRKLNIAEYSP